MGDERENAPGAVPEPTTMRLQAVEGAERADAVHEPEHVLTKADLATVEALRPGTALLVVLRGPNTGARFFLDDVKVSRKHAIFVRTPNGFVVRDVGSLNGTYVNRELVDEAVLRTGDEVQIGRGRVGKECRSRWSPYH